MAPKKKKKTLEDFMKDGVVVKGNDKDLTVQRIPVGFEDLDAILNGGIPRRRITVITGPYSSGKTFLLQLIMKQGLETGLQVGYIDTEQTYDPEWWGAVGLPLDELLVSQPVIGEQAVDVALAMVEAGIDIVVIDSLAALVPHEEAEAEATTKFVALQARLISKMLRLLLSTKHESAIVCANQLRDSIGGPFPTDIMPGGQALGFFSSLILRTQRSDWIEEEGKRVGFQMKIICRKSKVGQPFGECMLPFMFRGEIDELSMYIDRAIEAGLITQRGPYYSFGFGSLDGEKVLGRNTLLHTLEENEDMQESLKLALGGEQ